MITKNHLKAVHYNNLALGILVLVTVALFIGTIEHIITANTRLFYDTPLPSPLFVSSADVIGTNPVFSGNPLSQYTLVEFADYQCPPCKQTNAVLSRFLIQYAGSIRMTFRNLPLTSIHPQAMDAAITVEVARQKGRFWELHDAIYEKQQTLSNHSLVTLTKEFGLNTNTMLLDSARKRVENDIKYAKYLGIAKVPTFILCCPNGQVFELGTLDQVSAYLKP